MIITEHEIGWVTGCDPLQVWEINSKEDFYKNFPKNKDGETVLGDGLHLIAIVPNGYFLPIGDIKSKKDWNTLHNWGIPTLRDIL